jgi:hypothetical protein
MFDVPNHKEMTNKRMSRGEKKGGMWANMPLKSCMCCNMQLPCAPHFPCPPTSLFSASTKLPTRTKWWKSFKVEQTRKWVIIIKITTDKEETSNDHLKSMKIQSWNVYIQNPSNGVKNLQKMLLHKMKTKPKNNI